MNRGEARYYLQSSGFSEEQINTIEQAFKPKPTDDATLRDIFCMGCEYKEQEPCGDAIDRAEAIKIASGYCHPANVAKELEKLPPVNPTKTGHWINLGVQGEIDGQIVKGFVCSKCGAISVFRMTGRKIINGDLCPGCGAKMLEGVRT